MVENINVEPSFILGVFGNDSSNLVEGISQSKVKINNKFLKVCFISQEQKFYTTTVLKELRLYYENNYTEEIEDLLDDFGMDTEIFNRRVCDLSLGERYLVTILLNMIEDKDVYIFPDIFANMDYLNKKNLKAIIRRLKFANKIIIVESHNEDLLNEIVDGLLIIKDNKILIQGTLEQIYCDNIDILINNDVAIPKLCQITYKALKEKQVKLFYHQDVRDIIKDIYKHV